MRQYGSLRVVAAAAELLKLVESPSLLLPLKTINGADRKQLAGLIGELGLA